MKYISLMIKSNDELNPLFNFKITEVLE